MNIHQTTHDQQIILELAGRLDHEGAVILEEALLRLCSESTQVIILEMSGVDFVNSTGLRVLANFARYSQQMGCQLRLASLTPNVERVLDVVGFSIFFSPYATLQAALETH